MKHFNWGACLALDQETAGCAGAGGIARQLWRIFGRLRRHLAQTIPAQAILALLNRHRQPGGFPGAPARPRQAAGELRSASGTGEAAGDRNFQPVCHQSHRIPAGFFMPGSCRTAVYSATNIRVPAETVFPDSAQVA